MTHSLEVYYDTERFQKTKSFNDCEIHKYTCSSIFAALRLVEALKVDFGSAGLENLSTSTTTSWESTAPWAPN